MQKARKNILNYLVESKIFTTHTHTHTHTLRSELLARSITFSEQLNNTSVLIFLILGNNLSETIYTYIYTTNRGGNMPHRGEDMPHRGRDMPHRGEDMSHRGGNMPYRGEDMPHRGGNMPHRGGDMSHRGGNNDGKTE